MLLLFSIRVTERPPVWERVVNSVYRAVFRVLLTICAYAFIPFRFEGNIRILLY